MTDPLWKRNGDDDAEGSAQSSLRSDAGASGGSSRSDRGSPRTRRLPTKTSFPQISLKELVARVYEENQYLWEEGLRKRILSFGQETSVAAGKKARGRVEGEAGTAMGKEITELLHQSQQFSHIMVIINIRDTGPFQIPEKLLKEVGSKAPAGEKVKTTRDLVSRLEGILNKSRNYAKSHRSLLEEIAKTISRGTRDIARILEKMMKDAQNWAANIDTLVKEEFKRFLASIPKGTTSLSNVIRIAQDYATNIQTYANLLEKHHEKAILMIRDPTKAKQLEERVEMVPHKITPFTRKGGVKMRSSSI
ncbi:hypothetical protein BSLG_009282 [Batrachochytrium salamandrivorans]|nr:hypothetical protein BSLG_009282 [Batrachochytrium salamandrivorans]